MMKSNAQKPLSSILNKGPKPGVNREHPAVKLAEKIEQRLWNWNYLGPTKTALFPLRVGANLYLQ